MKASALAALLLVMVGSVRIALTWRVFNHTIDEPDQLAAGMEYLSTGKYLYEDRHPPLARVFGSLGPFAAGERFHPGPDSYREGYRILGFGTHYDRILSLGRAGILPFFWVACLVVYLWGRRASGDWAGTAAVLVFTTTPPILAHSGLITTDMALAAFTGAAALAALYWADRPDPRRSAILGALVALAILSKFTALAFLPAAWAGMWAVSQHKRFRVSRKAWALLAVSTVLVLWAAYGFSFARVEFLHLRLPAPRLATGIHSLWQHNQEGHPSYLLGRRSANGFWYYYPVVLAVKTPLGMLLVLLLGARLLPRHAWAPLAFSLAILGFAMLGRVDIGVRHILPVYIGFSVACGAIAASARGWPARSAIAVLLGWQAVSGALQHPDYLAYSNELTGGHPERVVADSDVDWGQDMKRLGAFLRQAGAAEVAFSPFNRTYTWAGHEFPAMTTPDSEHPSAGWNAASITIWKVFGFPAWVDRMPPGHRIGRSILVWYQPSISR